MKLGFRPPEDPDTFLVYSQTLAGYYQSVELPGTYASQLMKAVQKARRLGLKITFHARYVDLYLGSPVPEIRRIAVKLLREDLYKAAKVGAHLVVFHAGNVAWTDYPPLGLSPAHDALREIEAKMRCEYLERAREAIAYLTSVASKLGVRIALENLAAPQEVPRTPEEMAFFLEVPNLEFCLDLGHAKLSNCNIDSFLQKLGNRIGHLHVHTNDGIYDLHLPPSPQDFRGLDTVLAEDVIYTIELIPRNAGECLKVYKEVALQVKGGAR